MADIFISYSRRDSEEAHSLMQRLQADGHDVWLDKHGIEGAEQWATEIVEGITHCTTFLLLLSSSSIQSENVLKELSLASEKGKRILPVDIGFVTLPPSFEYQVAGIQRVPITDYDAIIRAHRRGVERKKASDIRKSLIILPFEDLSPEKDNQWFADGLAGELISALATIKSLRVLDRKTSLELRGVKQTSREIAQMYDTRYIVEGTVTKFGDRVKISASLIDTETRDHLWQNSFKGVMDDIFELQESVTEQIVSGLKLHLTSEEKSKLNERGTDNAEAYELYLKAIDYFGKQTKDGLYATVELLKEAIRIDPKFATAYAELANSYTVIYRRFLRDEYVLDDAEQNIVLAEKLGAKPADTYAIRGLLALRRRNFDEAMKYAALASESDHESARAAYVLGVVSAEIGKLEQAADALERYVKLRESDIGGNINYLITLEMLKQHDRLREAAPRALRVMERHIKFNPDDISARSTYAIALGLAGEHERAMEVAETIVNHDKIAPAALHNLASIFLNKQDHKRAMEIIKLSVERGNRDIESLQYYIEEKIEGIDEVVELMNKKIEEEKQKNG